MDFVRHEDNASLEVVSLTSVLLPPKLQGLKTVKQEVLDEELQKSRPYRTPG